MKKIITVAALLVSCNAMAQDTNTAVNPDAAQSPVESVAIPVVENQSEAPEATAQVNSGKIVIYRPSALMGYGVACPVRYKGVEIVELGRGKFAEWIVPAGSYILANKTASVEVNLAPGQTKYVRCQIKTGFMTGRADFQLVDEESFAENSANYGKKDIIEFSTFK